MTRKSTLQHRPLSLLLSAFLLLGSAPVWALELVMVEQAICPFCKMFNQEVGGEYAESELGKQAPLRRIDIANGWPTDLKNVKYDRLTPTFILVEDGVEVGRLRGYPGRDEFWDLLKKMLDRHTSPTR